MAKTPGRLMDLAKDWKDLSLSPRPWKSRRMAVVDSGGVGKWRDVLRRREEKSDSVGMRGGGIFTLYS